MSVTDIATSDTSAKIDQADASASSQTIEQQVDQDANSNGNESSKRLQSPTDPTPTPPPMTNEDRKAHLLSQIRSRPTWEDFTARSFENPKIRSLRDIPGAATLASIERISASKTLDEAQEYLLEYASADTGVVSVDMLSRAAYYVKYGEADNGSVYNEEDAEGPEVEEHGNGHTSRSGTILSNKSGDCAEDIGHEQLETYAQGNRKLNSGKRLRYCVFDEEDLEQSSSSASHRTADESLTPLNKRKRLGSLESRQTSIVSGQSSTKYECPCWTVFKEKVVTTTADLPQQQVQKTKPFECYKESFMHLISLHEQVENKTRASQAKVTAAKKIFQEAERRLQRQLSVKEWESEDKDPSMIEVLKSITHLVEIFTKARDEAAKNVKMNELALENYNQESGNGPNADLARGYREILSDFSPEVDKMVKLREIILEFGKETGIAYEDSEHEDGL